MAVRTGRLLPMWGLGVLLCEVIFPAVRAADAPTAQVEQSVVQVFATVQPPATLRPWTRQPPQEITGSGVVVEGGRIVTNAHVVGYASVVQIQASDSGQRIAASVEAIDPQMDLALLKVNEAGFAERHPPLARAGNLPAVKDSVLVYGFPRGGTALSITKGIVSRIEYTGYSYPAVGLRIQIDAAVNNGNSGGPALVDDRLVGIARSVLANAQNISYIIPTEEIELFLADLADGRHDGKPFLFDDLQTIESPALRAFLKMPADAHGIMVRRPNSSLPGNPLREWDVITHIGDAPVDDQGMVQTDGGLRLRFPYMLQKLRLRDSAPLTVLREGRPIKVQMPLVHTRQRLIADLDGAYPSYFIHGPIVFSTVSAQLMTDIARTPNAPAGSNVINPLDAFSLTGSPLVTMRSAFASAERQELVFIPSGFFPHPVTSGYRNASLNVIDSLNGRTVKSLAHLVEMLRDLKDDYIVLRFLSASGGSLVLPRKEMQAATEQVLQQNGIRDFASPELMAIWKKK